MKFPLVNEALHRLTQIVDTLNVNLYREYDSDIKCVLSGVENTVRYRHIADNGPKLTHISQE